MTKPDARVNDTVGARVRFLRKERAWSIDRLAEAAEISKGFLSLVENGKTAPGGAVLLRIARALGASVDFLLTGRDPSGQPSAPPSIPPELIVLAQARGWTVGYVVQLLGAQRQIIAQRNGRSRGPFTMTEWQEFEAKVGPYLTDEGDEKQ